MMMKRISFFFLLFLMSITVKAQQATGLNGLIHVPTADMDTVGLARLGGQFVPKEMVPEAMNPAAPKVCSQSRFSGKNEYSNSPFRF